METKEELHRIVDLLPQPEAEDALEYLRWLIADEETLTPDELAAVEVAESQVKAGNYVTLTDLARSLSLDV